MTIVYVNPFFTEGMGYIENALPIAMAKRGHDVHIITSRGKVYFNSPFYDQTYKKHFGEAIVKKGEKKLQENLTLHRLDYKLLLNSVYFIGLRKELEKIKPDIVHFWEVVTPYCFQFIIQKFRFKYLLYSGNHYLLSVFELHKTWGETFSLKKIRWLILKKWPGLFLSRFYDRIYAATIDACFVATKYMGAKSHKCIITPLGVDTDIFKPVSTATEVNEAQILKSELGYEDLNFILIYTGRFTTAKNPLILAKAINDLNNDGYKNIKGLFVGAGEQKNNILQCLGCNVVDFVPYYLLDRYYQIANVGVWPTQESTSMLDAASAGLPIIVNDTIKAIERYENNGLTYKLLDLEDLKAKILTLYNDRSFCKELGRNGREKMEKLYSWNKIAEEREFDYLNDTLKKHQ